MADLRLHVDGLEELRAVTEAIAQEERDIPVELVLAIQDKARELAQRARDAVQGEPVHGVKHTGLRARIAAGTSVDDNPDGATIAAGLEGNAANLPEDMNHGSWEHPTNDHGYQNTWVTQGGYYAWFSDVMDAGEDDIENALGDVLDGAIDRIASA